MTPAETEAMLTGQHVKLYPYVRGQFPPETLFTLWSLMRSQGALDRIFFGRPNELPFQTRGDLVEFIRVFEPEPPAQRWLLMVGSQKKPDDIVGMCWFDDYVPKHRVAGSVFYRRKYWGEPAAEATRLAIRWAFACLEVQSVWAYSPWKAGQQHALHAGMTHVATLPAYVVIGDGPADMAIYRVTQDEARTA
jgi:hypothetical protein